MAEIVTIEGQEFKRRSPLGSWGLAFITIGIYSWVWYFKINDEARRYLRDDRIRPGVSLLAVTLGALVVVPALISIYRTGERIQRMQENARISQRTEPVIGLIAYLVYLLHVPYYQSGLNRVWDPYGVVAPAGVPPPAPLPPPAAPPEQ